MAEKTPLDRGIEAARTIHRQCGRALVRWVTQPGRHDLYLSALATAVLFAPLLAEPVAAQVGIGGAENVLCDTATTGFNLAQLITIGFGLISGYFILKFLFRTMTGLDKAGSPNSGVQQEGKQTAKGGVYSLIAAMLPLLVPVFLNTVGVNPVDCLIPQGSGTAAILVLL